jgi:type VI secretion system protein ImpL
MERTLLTLGLALLALCCVGLVAWISVLTGMSLLWPLLLAGLFSLLGLAWFIASRLRARRAARDLERGLMDQGKAQLKLTRPDQRGGSQQLQRDFERAVRDLKSSRLGRSGRDALYLLPWYAIIGPSGAGKTTALRHSGLRFPNLRGQENFKVKGLGGTRNCDFWLSNDAVLLDTAGRWSTQDDQPEWLGFLQLLRRHRPRKPLNGLIAAISIGEVVNASSDEIDALAERMRNRLEELISELRVSIPVYVLFTKCDLVEGFVQMFGALRATDREQILGFTVPLSRADSAPEALFEAYFEELTDALRGAAITRMGEERAARERQLVYAFPEQFWAMRRNLNRFVTRLFEANVYSESMPLRGVYFSSGTQEGRPFSLLDATGEGAPELVDHKGYFLRELFMRVIFEDSQLASASRAELRRQRIVRGVLTGALASMSLTLGVIPVSAYLHSRHQLGITSELVSSAESAVHPGDTLKRVLDDVARYAASAPGWLTTLGMYNGDRVLPLLRRYSATLLRRELVQPKLARDLTALTDFGFRYQTLALALPTPSEHATFYDLLKLHLLLSTKELPKAYAQWVAGQLASTFEAAELGRPGAALAAEYAQFAQLYPELAVARDAEAIRRARAALTRASPAQQALDAIVAHVSSLGYDLDLPKIAGYGTALQGGRRVRGAFTRRGWEQTVREMFAAGAPEHVDELWVLGTNENAPASPERAARLAELEQLYFRAYVQEWRSFIDALRTRAPHNGNHDALALITELTSGEPTPLARVFRAVQYNTHLLPRPEPELPAPAKELLTKALELDPRKNRDAQRAETFSAADVASAFDSFASFGVSAAPAEADGGGRAAAPTPYDAYREQLNYLRDALQLRVDNPAEAKQLDERIQSAVVRVRSLIDTQPPSFRPAFEALLWPPIKGIREDAGREGAAWMGGQWCNEVVTPYEHTLLGRYPFIANGPDARLEDIDAFYKPGEGLLWKFTNATLAEQVQLSGGDAYTFSPKLDAVAAPSYSHALLEFLNRSRALMKGFYAGNAQSAQLEFKLRLHNASSKIESTSFSVGGKRVSYDNGPLAWQSLVWPGPEPAKGASFTVRGTGLRAGNEMAGLWGLFRLLESGEVQRGADDAISISWQIPSEDLRVVIDLKSARAEAPFFDVRDRAPQPRLFRALRGPGLAAPRRIASAQPSCSP